MELEDILKRENSFRYQLLDRMQNDCNYYLGFGQRNTKYLWADNEKEHIEIMTALYESFDEKPEWITLETIEDYKKNMVSESLNDVVNDSKFARKSSSIVEEKTEKPTTKQIEKGKENMVSELNTQKLILEEVGIDWWSRPVYKDNKGKIWVDIELGDYDTPVLYSVIGNEMDGEPCMPIDKEYEIVDRHKKENTLNDVVNDSKDASSNLNKSEKVISDITR